jgi:hypothetical protein
LCFSSKPSFAAAKAPSDFIPKYFSRKLATVSSASSAPPTEAIIATLTHPF